MSANYSTVVGDTVRITLTVRRDGAPTSSTVTWTIEEPDGTNNAPSNTTPSTGVARTTFVPDQPGYHRWRAVGSAPDFVREGTFYVTASSIIVDA